MHTHTPRNTDIDDNAPDTLKIFFSRAFGDENHFKAVTAAMGKSVGVTYDLALLHDVHRNDHTNLSMSPLVLACRFAENGVATGMKEPIIRHYDNDVKPSVVMRGSERDGGSALFKFPKTGVSVVLNPSTTLVYDATSIMHHQVVEGEGEVWTAAIYTKKAAIGSILKTMNTMQNGRDDNGFVYSTSATSDMFADNVNLGKRERKKVVRLGEG